MTPDERASQNRLHARTEAALVHFLQADLNLAFTMLNTAEISKGSDSDHYAAMIRRVRQSLDTIRCLEGRIQDPAAWGLVHDRADELEEALSRVTAY
jgi:hypothetical protein